MPRKSCNREPAATASQGHATRINPIDLHGGSATVSIVTTDIQAVCNPLNIDSH